MKPILIICFLVLSHFLNAQDKIVFDKENGFIDHELDSFLLEEFKSKDLLYTNFVDFSNQCDYYFAEIREIENAIILELKKCNKELIGKAELSVSLQHMAKDDQARLIVFKTFDLIKNPSKPDRISVSTSNRKFERRDTSLFESNPFSSHYYLAPSSRSLPKGEVSVNTMSLALHELNWGITDNFSLGFGGTTILLPIYVVPKYSIKLSETSHIGIGDMFIYGTFFNFTINNLFVNYTFGNEHNQITAGGGWLYSPEGSLFEYEFSKSLVNISGMARIANNSYFISENYFFRTPSRIQAVSTVLGQQSTLVVENSFMLGYAGFRLISKRNRSLAWNLGLYYFSRQLPEMPQIYSNPALWRIEYPQNLFFVFPAISFNYKFGNND